MGLYCRNLSASFSSLCLLSVIHLLCFNLPVASAIHRNNDTDRLSLLEFKATISNDPLGVMSSWKSTLHFCRWYGVTCGRRHQRVTMLDLNSLKLSGSISPHVGNLSFLRKLSLQNNSFTHEIPPQIGYLRRLQVLSLYNNSFDGQIPSSISNCSNLVFFYLDNNNFAGKIPAELGSLVKLKAIYLQSNNFIGTFPSSFGNLSSLEELPAYQNHLHGNLPETFGQLKSLRDLAIFRNGFSGTIPSSIFNLSSIIYLDLGVNNFHGKLPLDIGNSLPNLQFFSIAENQFRGTIPASMSNASNLELVDLPLNNLAGGVPSLAKLHRLSEFVISGNNLGSGKADDLRFLSTLTNATALKFLFIDANNFGGELPEYIANFSKELQFFGAELNQISGNIPVGIQALVNLEMFLVDRNKLSGNIPSGIGQLQNLKLLYLGNNKLSGYIPSSLGNLTNLLEVVLSNNYLQGTIPSSLGKCMKLLRLDFSVNNLSGPIPSQVIGLSSLSKVLDLSLNNLSGSLPKAIENLKNLEILALHGNMLSGELPMVGVFKNSSATFVGGNKNLCGGILGVALLFICLLLWRNSKKRKGEATSLFDGKSLLKLSYQSLLKATNGFSPDNLIGVGSFGSMPRSVNIIQRLNIAIDVASAVEYLHYHCGTPIVHCDLKPSNVLLDEEIVGHSSGMLYYSTNHSSSLGIRGTIGYCPPEYGVGSEVSMHGDVFSFGILLLEMFTGKRPTDDMFKDNLSLHNYVKRGLPEQVKEIVDPKLFHMQLDADATSNHNHNLRNRRNNMLIECLTSILEIGIYCSMESPQERMNISDVITQLSSVRSKLIETRF
ncbi:probable LRR receptor-like serine/threonine-protein kinase At3g47570 [Manihot esculenta]|uniref:probable LRR receptor-like serine/threonine-protein kinase At3g47570 n=1 Tax=Manihot esculenta TaxID=3983 RepID=UPI001CC78403|nr:probable LRR receptor-like serine/threonine-protein kinase At3g47570 [Manihot esculenta]